MNGKWTYPDFEGGYEIGKHNFDKDGFCIFCGEKKEIKTIKTVKVIGDLKNKLTT